MSKTISLREYNKRASVTLNAKELDLIEGMKSFGEEKVVGAFTALTGRDISEDDVKLAILILELSEALTPPVMTVRDPLVGSPSIWPRTPSQPYTLGAGDILCGRGLTSSLVDLTSV